jgi:3-oxoadipate enol-lactonase
MSFIQCGGNVFFYQRRPGIPANARGTAEPATLVFVNGLGTDHRIWDEVVAALPSDLSIIRYDQRGHGLSEEGSGPYRVADLSADLAELLERSNVGPVMVCGLSLGGLVAQDFAASHPERVRALCLSGTGLRIGTREAWMARITQVLGEGLAGISHAVMERWFSESFRARDPETVRGHRAMLERVPMGAYVSTLHALAEADLSGSVHRIRVPTLVIAGELDPATPPDVGRALAGAIPGAEFELMRGAGHLMCVEQPRAFARALTRFLGDNGLLGDSGLLGDRALLGGGIA